MNRRQGQEGIGEEGELFCTHIGGSATLEGVMMRGRLNWAVAIRQEDGTIYLEEHDLPSKEGQPRWWSWPIARGCVSFAQSMKLSLMAMNIAAEHAFTGEAESAPAGEGPGTAETSEPATATTATTATATAATSGSATISTAEFLAAAGFGIAVGIGLFMALPVWLSNLIAGELTSENALAWNLVEAAVRIALLVAYIWACGRFPDMARLFGYHGAEHQAIHCFEHGEPLTPANCRRYSRIHVRCGTAFLVMTVATAIIVNSLVPVAALADALAVEGIARNLLVFASRLVLLPLVAGITFEVTVKWAGAHAESPLVHVLLWPGLQMQRITTAVPDEGMLECAIAALTCVDARERRH